MSIKDTVLNATGIAALMQGLGKSSEEVKEAAGVLADIEIEKAAATVSQPLTDVSHVTDRWNQGAMHGVPGSDKLKTGPTQHASGGGAEKMVSEYSHPAPQVHLTVESERLAAELGSLRGYAKAQTEVITRISKSQEAMTGVLTALLTKQAGEEAETGVPGEAASFQKYQAQKANGYYRAFKAVLAKSEQIHDQLDDLELPEARKAAKAQIKDLRKKAARLALKTLAATYAAKSEESDPAAEARKSLHNAMESDARLKADIAALHDKDRDKDEEKGAKKRMKKLFKKAAAKLAKKAAAKAADTAPAGGAAKAVSGNDKGNQADRQDPETKNQDDAAKATETTKTQEETAADVKKALEGLGLMQGTIQQVFELVAGRPITNNAINPPALMKAGDMTATTVMNVDQKIEDAVAKGELDQMAEMRARDLLMKTEHVREGRMTQDMWDSMLRQAPLSVQQIYRPAA